jgi:hypothetical protein
MSKLQTGGWPSTWLGLALGLGCWAGAVALSGAGLTVLGDPSRGAVAWLHATAGGELLFALLLGPWFLAPRPVRRELDVRSLGISRLAVIVMLLAGAALRLAVVRRVPELWRPALATLTVALVLLALAAAVARVAARWSSDPAIISGAPVTSMLVLALAPWFVAPLRAAPGGGEILQIAGVVSPLVTMSSALGLDLFRLEALYRPLGLGAVHGMTAAWYGPALGYLVVAGLAIVLVAPGSAERPAPEGFTR